MATRTTSLAAGRLLIVLFTVTACSAGEVECDDAAIRQVVQEFSTGMQKLSYSSRQRVSGDDLSEAYDGTVTAELLASWVADPGQAPGMHQSSRWPTGLEVTSVRSMEDACRVEVDVKYVRRSSEASGPAVETEPAILRIVSTSDGNSRVANYRVNAETTR